MILDACCGPKEMYHGLHKKFTDQEIVYIDIRKGTFTIPYTEGKKIHIEPTVQADLKKLPFKDNTFTLILFDPPHGGFTIDTWMGAKYGGLTASDYKNMLVWANIEFTRVLVEGGIILAKIQEYEDREFYITGFFHNFKLLLDIKIRSRGTSKSERLFTHWLVFAKKPSPIQQPLYDTYPQCPEASAQPEQPVPQCPPLLQAHLSEP